MTTPKERERVAGLVKALIPLHQKAARRGSCSKVCLINTFFGSGDINKAIAAAILSFGEAHGPIENCYDLLDDPSAYDLWDRVPGFGCSFKEEEGTYDEVRKYVDQETLDEIDGIAANIGVAPNIAIYTAYYARLANIPKKIAPSLLISFRLKTWIQILMEEFNLIPENL